MSIEITDGALPSPEWASTWRWEFCTPGASSARISRRNGGWNEDDKSLPYMFACLVFSLIMVPAGRMQDKLSPSWWPPWAEYWWESVSFFPA